jgi:hypothetical protein
MTERNETCGCGSGKKYKKCCLQTDQAKVKAMQCCVPGCAARGIGTLRCSICGKERPHCAAHVQETTQVMNGHVLRVHPEEIPETIDELMKRPAAMAALEVQMKAEPALWEKLRLEIDKRRN